MKQKIVLGEPVDSRLYCNLMLRKVSRTFALTTRTSGFPFREPVLLGYLFCRIADTCEDSPLFEPRQKTSLLDDYAALFKADGNDAGRMERLKNMHGLSEPGSDEEFLAKHLDIIFDAYGRLAQNVRSIIQKTVLEMVHGMKETVIRHSSQKKHRCRLRG